MPFFQPPARRLIKGAVTALVAFLMIVVGAIAFLPGLNEKWFHP